MPSEPSSSEKSIRRVVLIDDDSTDNFLHHRVLESSGLVERIAVFEGAEQALEHMQQDREPMDVIFVDINMPRMDGLEFIEAFRNLFADRASNPIIVVLSTSISPDATRRLAEFSDLKIWTESKPLRKDVIQRLTHELT